MSQKLDRRVQRTRRLLREALIALTLEHGYDTITIQDITDYANLGRATFYLHYKDKDALLLSTLDELIDDLMEHIGPRETALIKPGSGESVLLTLFRHAAENADLYRIILLGSGAASVERRLRALAMDLARDSIEHLLDGHPSAIPVDLAANYFSRSVLGTIDWWLNQGMPYSPDYMAGVLDTLCLETIFTSLGITAPEPDAAS